MQRILSVEASRDSSMTSDFVTKRFCCSFILTVCFFSIIGGFLLGRFASDKTIQKMQTGLEGISRNVQVLEAILREKVFCSNCSTTCPTFPEPAGDKLDAVRENLERINECFNNG